MQFYKNVIHKGNIMKVLLVYPEYPLTFWSFKYALKFLNIKTAFPPLGLLTVSSLLPADWEKKLIDMNVDKLNDKDILWADAVFISGMVVQKTSAGNVIDRIKAMGKFVVAGGPLFTNNTDDYKNVDCFVLNEGEATIPLFLKDFPEGEVKHIYSSSERPDITKTPLPDWSLINIKNYSSLSIQFSRGCPFNCEFCDIIVMNGRIPRNKTTEQMIAELDAVYATGWKGGLFIVDDNFIGNKNKVKDLLRSIKIWMKEKKYPFALFTEASINLSEDEELMTLMREANFDNVFIGIETPNETALQLCGKTQNTNINLVESVKKIQRNGIAVMGGFILGFDSDTPHIFDDMIQFIQKSGIVSAMVGLLNAFPETGLYKRLFNEGRLLNQPSGSNTDTSINFQPVMSIEALKEGYKKVLETIFCPKNLYSRIQTFMNEFKPAVKGKIHHFSVINGINAVLNSIWKFGIIDSSRHHFWKMFFWALFRKPHLISKTISCSIFGYHFRKVMIEAVKNNDI
jgi:radical SAM superfamily enzyme YgiQ (UPF0313 family)